MTRLALILVTVGAASMLASCSSSRKAADGDKGNIPNLRTAELIERVHENDLACDWLSIKYEVNIKTSKVEDSFKMYVRMRKDSVIWISATYYAVEIARFLFTPDSVKYIDRRNNKFYVGDYDYITDRFMIEADFATLQSLILANGSAFTYNTDEKVRSAKDDGSYYLSFLRKGQYRRAMKKDDLKKPLNLVISLWVNPENFRINKATVVDFDEDRSITASYSDFRPECNSFYPYSIDLMAESPNEQAHVKTSVIKLSSDKKVSVSFTIPDKYEPLVP